MDNRIKKRNNNKTLTPESKFQSEFSICSKKKDFAGAISLFDSAISQNLKLNLHHLNCFLYICSNSIEGTGEMAIEKGFNIFNHMISSKINPNEATITAISRLAAAKDDADLSFELVKSLVKYNEKPRLRTYDPALFCYVKKSDAEKAYLVEKEVLSMGLSLEEPEIAALLKVSVEVGNEEKVYEYLHKLRMGVRCVSESTAEIIESWFNGEIGAKVGGLENRDMGQVKDVILRNGGGWHGIGWIGRGKWMVQRTTVGSDGRCCACKEQLACVDIGGEETEKFSQSLVALAIEREKRSNFTQFQNWLDQHHDFEAIVDGANIGLYQQNFAEGGFSVSQVVHLYLIKFSPFFEQLEAVVNELYNRSKKWPLVILHDKRIRSLLANLSNRGLLEEWIERGLLYGTPVGSNDDWMTKCLDVLFCWDFCICSSLGELDYLPNLRFYDLHANDNSWFISWYWLYASVKLKCMLATNDEMRDHIFELLGRSFFPRWKERHQVHYTFAKGKPKLQLPPSYSLVYSEESLYQESERGTWHAPLAGEYNEESLRTWLCITRSEASVAEPSETNGIHDQDSNSSTKTQVGITGKRKERSPSPIR
ncbi:hypothetical protein OSB04_009636 [Centaurea solstitialis]|uniref:ribonuclease P n=1 Tax=Centaurea solstitialis TaxID=347529 RepID=A0AA38WB41_9ASTR|nr:hypothetical protein OSB04_009636 [Centaurea solstitialis]